MPFLQKGVARATSDWRQVASLTPCEIAGRRGHRHQFGLRMAADRELVPFTDHENGPEAQTS